MLTMMKTWYSDSGVLLPCDWDGLVMELHKHCVSFARRCIYVAYLDILLAWFERMHGRAGMWPTHALLSSGGSEEVFVPGHLTFCSRVARCMC